MSSILFIFLSLQKPFFLIFLYQNVCSFHSFLYCKEKKYFFSILIIQVYRKRLYDFSCSFFLFIVVYESSCNNLEAVCLCLPNKMTFLIAFNQLRKQLHSNIDKVAQACLTKRLFNSFLLKIYCLSSHPKSYDLFKVSKIFYFNDDLFKVSKNDYFN